MPRIHLTVVLALACFCGCAAARALGRPAPKSAEEMYNNAMEDLDDGLYPEATAGFTEVKTKYPYSKFAALADLRNADTNFERGKYLEAIDGYRVFVKFHPNHEEAPYAYFRIGESYDKQIPEDWFFLPPSAEKDQVNTRLAIAAYRDVVDRYAQHDYAKKARERMAECRRFLADHELYVAKFYWKRDRYAAAALRAEGLVKDYAGLGLDAEALWIAAQARDKNGEPALARDAAERIVRDFKDSTEASSAQALLQRLPRDAKGS